MAHLVEDEGKAEKAASKKHKKRKKRRSSSRQRDEERKRAVAYEYLCHLEEAKVSFTKL